MFTISSVKATKPPTYTIKEELQLSAQEMFRIERVLKKKKNQVFVKWKGYSDAFSSWVLLTDLET